MQTHFTGTDLSFLLAGFLFAAGSVIASSKEKDRLALLLLVAAGFTFRLMMAFIDPFIHLWDEEFHAMVARNMMSHPFTPTLYENPVMPFTPGNWGMSQIWLHKPPFFLWQMALSMKLFGATTWAVRIPSVILTTLMIPAVYRMGVLISGKRKAYFAAFLLCLSCFQINIVSGFLNTDHNDVVFLAYVTFSFWTWTEAEFSFKWKWVVLTGLFSGIAILVKFLPGLLVFGAWGLTTIINKETRFSRQRWKAVFVSVLIAIALAGAWYLYIYLRWPAETKAALGLQMQHFNDALQHEEPWYFHFSELAGQYGWWFVVLLPFAVLVFLRNAKRNDYRLSVMLTVVFVYVFYSLVKTKMPLFCLPVSPLLLLILASLFDFAVSFVPARTQRLLMMLVLLPAAWLLVDTGRLEHFHTDRDPHEIYRKARIANKAQFEKAASLLPSRDFVLFNCGGYCNGIACMFYTGITSYSEIPDKDRYEQLKKANVKMAVFDDSPLPGYLASDSTLLKIHLPLIRNGF